MGTENMQGMSPLLVPVETRFVTPNVIYPGECPCAPEKSVFAAALGRNALNVSVKSFWSCFLVDPQQWVHCSEWGVEVPTVNA